MTPDGRAIHPRLTIHATPQVRRRRQADPSAAGVERHAGRLVATSAAWRRMMAVAASEARPFGAVRPAHEPVATVRPRRAATDAVRGGLPLAKAVATPVRQGTADGPAVPIPVQG